MTDEDRRNEQPIAYEVIAIWGGNDFVLSPIGKKPKLTPLINRFATQAAAADYKKQRQAAGWIASVRPIFIGKAKRTAALRKRQSTPFGDFCAAWRLAE
jgi:hypothetical protein